MSEASILEIEAADAKSAISDTLAELRESVKTAGDVRLWTERHPWVMVSMAGALGLAAAASFVPAKDEKFTDKVQRTARRVKPKRKAATNGAPHGSKAQQEEVEETSLLGALISKLFDTLSVVLQTTIISALQTPPSAPGATATRPWPSSQDQADTASHAGP